MTCSTSLARLPTLTSRTEEDLPLPSLSMTMPGKSVLSIQSAVKLTSFIRDAEDAVHSRDGYDMDGYKLRVEFPRGRERGPGGAFVGGRGRDGRGSDRFRDRGRNSDRGPPSRRSNYRVIVSCKLIFS